MVVTTELRLYERLDGLRPPFQAHRSRLSLALFVKLAGFAVTKLAYTQSIRGAATRLLRARVCEREHACLTFEAVAKTRGTPVASLRPLESEVNPWLSAGCPLSIAGRTWADSGSSRIPEIILGDPADGRADLRRVRIKKGWQQGMDWPTTGHDIRFVEFRGIVDGAGVCPRRPVVSWRHGFSHSLAALDGHHRMTAVTGATVEVVHNFCDGHD